MGQVLYLEAIRQALIEEMERDERVFLMGEDIGVYGGAFKVTEGLVEKFGEERVMDTPLSEAGYTGAGIGAAFMGLRPVIEIQFADFSSVCFDAICNIGAKSHWRWGAPCPIVVRLPFGGGISGGPFHSQCPETWYVHTPGLKVVAPAFPDDAKGLLKAAIRDDDPVMYFEHKFLYRRIRGEVPDGDHVVPIGKARVVRPGSDLTMISYAATLHNCLEAAETLAREGVDAEVVDLRSLLPWDKPAVLESVRKTGKALVAYEASRTLGFGAEVAAVIAEEAFEYLDGPVTRVGGADTPVPYAPQLEQAYLPGVDDILAAARRLAAY